MLASHHLGVIGLLRMIGKPLFFMFIAGSVGWAAMIALLHSKVRRARPELAYDLSTGSPAGRATQWLSRLRHSRHLLPPRLRLLHTATLTMQYALLALVALLVLDALVTASARL